MSNMNIPSALRTKPMPSVDSMKIESSILDPQTINSRRCVFQFDRKGILDAGSMIQIGATVTDSAVPATSAEVNNFLPLGTGAYSFISTARLYCGTNVIATAEDVPFYNYIKEQFISNEQRYRKSSVTKGTNSVMHPETTGLGHISLKDMKEFKPLNFGNQPNRNTLTTSDDTTPLYYLKLSDLFSMLKGVQLPLYLIESPISVHLEFNQQLSSNVNNYQNLGNMCCWNQPTITAEKTLAGSRNLTCNISTENVKLIADYLTFDDNTMGEMARRVMGEGLNLPYEDLIVTRREIQPAAAGQVTPTDITCLVAVAGRTVRNIMVHCQMDVPILNADYAPLLPNNAVEPRNPLLGPYGSMAPPQPLEYNVRVNDNNIYPRTLTMPATQYTELSKVHSLDMNTNIGIYSWDPIIDYENPANAPNAIVSTELFAGFSQRTVLSAQSFILGLDLSKSQSDAPGTGMYIEKPIEFRMRLPQNDSVANYTGMAPSMDFNQKRTFRFFTAVERVMVIRNGQISLTN